MSNQSTTSAADLVVAIDGPSGSGKSSVARRVAAALGMRYLDTGAMYRAVTWWLLEQGVDLTDPDRVAELVGRAPLRMGLDPDRPTVHVADVDVGTAIRESRISAAVSHVATNLAVRAELVSQQQAIAAERGVVVEGRDITTVVAPDAEVKLYLTASEQARAERRSAELELKDTAATRDDLARRDRIDSGRAVAPLRRTDDALELETSGMSLEEVVAAVVQLAAEAERRGE